MSSSPFPIASSKIAGLFVESTCYGMLLITVAYGLRVLLWSCNGQFKGRASISWVMVGATLAMFVISTIEMALKIRNDLDAFVDYKGLGGATGAFLDVSDWIQVARTAGYNLQTSIGDGIMVYRCYVVYDRNWRIIVVPVLLWLVTTACGWMALYMEATFGTAERLVPFVTPFLALTLALTTMTTGMVVYRILDINADLVSHNVSRVGGGPKLTRIVRILIECGALYTISVVILLCTFLGSKNALSDVWVVQLIPISMILIIIRVDQCKAAGTSTFQISAIERPMTFIVESGMPGSDASRGITVSMSDFHGSQTDTSNHDVSFV